MDKSTLSAAELVVPKLGSFPGFMRTLRDVENLLVVVVLAVMTLLLIGEMALRKFFHSGIPASAPMVQHLVLIVGMLGGAIAARENRLLALSAATRWFKGNLLAFARVFS